MRGNKLEIRGCCFGIPIGCGALMLMGFGGLLSQVPLSNLSGFVVLKFLAAVVSVLVLGAGALLTLGWREEKRRLQYTP